MDDNKLGGLLSSPFINLNNNNEKHRIEDWDT